MVTLSTICFCGTASCQDSLWLEVRKHLDGKKHYLKPVTPKGISILTKADYQDLRTALYQRDTLSGYFGFKDIFGSTNWIKETITDSSVSYMPFGKIKRAKGKRITVEYLNEKALVRKNWKSRVRVIKYNSLSHRNLPFHDFRLLNVEANGLKVSRHKRDLYLGVHKVFREDTLFVKFNDIQYLRFSRRRRTGGFGLEVVGVLGVIAAPFTGFSGGKYYGETALTVLGVSLGLIGSRLLIDIGTYEKTYPYFKAVP